MVVPAFVLALFLAIEYSFAEGELITAFPSGSRLCIDEYKLGFERIPRLALPDYEKVFLLKCDCECTANENNLQIIGVSANRIVRVSEYIGYGIRLMGEDAPKNAVFAIVGHFNTGKGIVMDEDTVFLSGGKLVGANGKPNPPELVSNKELESLVRSHSDPPKANMDVQDLSARASALYKAGKKAEAGKLVTENIGDYPYPVTRKRAGQYNDLAFYLVEAGMFAKGAEILEAVLSHDPNRTVAYLNLADALAGMGKSDTATIVYRDYVERMEASGKGKKVPVRVRALLNP